MIQLPSTQKAVAPVSLQKQEVPLFPVFLALTSLVTALSLQRILKETFFDWSLDLMFTIDFPDSLRPVIDFLALCGKTTTARIFILSLLAFRRNKEAFFVLTTTQSSELTGRMLKVLIGTMRPWYFRSGITGCLQGFANPSGHDTAATALLLSTWLLFNHKYGRKVGKGVSYLLAGIFMAILFLISFHRLLKQRHTIDQLLLAIVIGAAVTTICWHLIYLNQRIKQRNEAMSSQEKTELFKKMFLISILLVSTCSAICYMSTFWHPQDETYYNKLEECLGREMEFKPRYQEQIYYFGLSFNYQQVLISYFLFTTQETQQLKSRIPYRGALILFSMLFTSFYVTFWYPNENAYFSRKNWVFNVFKSYIIPSLASDVLLYRIQEWFYRK